MEEIKMRNFAAAHPNVALPKTRRLEPAECESLRSSLAKKLGLLHSAAGLEILKALEGRARDVLDIRPSDEAFSPARLLAELQGGTSDIYLNWHRFDDIDEMNTEEFSSVFHDLWYPASDDIELFDQNLDWVLLVRHFDILQIVRFTE